MSVIGSNALAGSSGQGGGGGFAIPIIELLDRYFAGDSPRSFFSADLFVG